MLALVVLMSFAASFGVAMYGVFTAPAGRPAAVNEALDHVATALSALIGGYFTAALGIKGRTPLGRTSLNSRRWRLRRFAFPSEFASHSPGRVTLGPSTREAIGSCYAIVYAAVGVAAIIVWIHSPLETSSLVKNLALTFGGLVPPMVLAFLRGE